MAAPNIVNVSAIYGKTTTVDLTTTAATQVLSNAASSGKVLKVNSLYVANTNPTVASAITINYYNGAALGGTPTPICSTVSVPADATLIVIDRSSSIYLEENCSIGAIALASDELQIVCSYEEIN